MLSRCHFWSLSLLTCSLFLGLAHAASDDKTKIGNSTIDRTVQLRTHSLYAPFIDQDLQNRYNTNKHVRLTQPKPSQMGWLWSRLPLTATNFVIEVEFKISGDAGHLFGDGLAIWLTKERTQPGPVFGNQDKFEGLGIFLDTYDFGKDGDGQDIGACSANFRRTNVATKVKITYVKDTFLDVKLQYKAWDDWTECFRKEKVTLASAPFLGFSAMTGDVFDAHDIISVTTYSAVLSPQSAQRDKSSTNFFSRNKEGGGSWMGTFFKLFLFAGVCAGAYYGYEEYKRRNMYGGGNFGGGMMGRGGGGGYGGGYGGGMYDKRF
ncbi:concanavalin A-like lectin/glucanase domain-containing protein [Mycena sp. CBHHK59/15]|nr:concanavalin A-like lectin/glucanase domain-containing protein [Mycena sp. CBHHK59/15]